MNVTRNIIRSHSNGKSLLRVLARDKKPQPLQLLGSGTKEETCLEFLCIFVFGSHWMHVSIITVSSSFLLLYLHLSLSLLVAQVWVWSTSVVNSCFELFQFNVISQFLLPSNREKSSTNNTHPFPFCTMTTIITVPSPDFSRLIWIYISCSTRGWKKYFMLN